MFGYVGDIQPAKSIDDDMVSVTFEPQDGSELKQFFEENTNRFPEIWVIITK